MLVFVALVAAAALAGAVLLVRATLKFRKIELAIPGPPSLPLLGNSLTFAAINHDDFLNTLVRMWGGRTEMTRLSFFNHLVAIVSSPEDIFKVVKSKEFCDKSDMFYHFVGYGVPRGLFQINGALWKAHRQALQPAFHRSILEAQTSMFVEEAERYAAGLPLDQSIDVTEGLPEPLVRMFVRASLTPQIEPSANASLKGIVVFIAKILECVSMRCFKPWLWPDLTFGMTGAARRAMKGLIPVRDYICKNILAGQMRESDWAAGAGLKGHDKTMLAVLLEALQDGRLEERDIVDEIITFFAGATHTGVATLSYVFKILSIKPDVQKRVYAEVADVLGTSKLDFATIHRLQYLEQVIMETMRAVPTAPFFARQVKETTQFSGKTLPAGTTLVINALGAHRDPRHWPNPERFDPERFAPEKIAAMHPCAFMPFSVGSRDCIGKHYAMLVMKALVATVLRDYRIDPVDDGITDHSHFHITFTTASKMVGGSWVKFTARRPPVG